MGMKPLMASSSLPERLEHFLDELCEGWGFCSISSDLRSTIVNADEITADEFAHKVLKGEGFIPEYEKQWVRELREHFTSEFGPIARAKDYKR